MVFARARATNERTAKPGRSNGEFGGSCYSQIFRPQAGRLCDPGQHAGADLFVVVEGEHKAIVDRLPLRTAIQVVAGGQRPLELG
jgi:hypothetical protein